MAIYTKTITAKSYIVSTKYLTLANFKTNSIVDITDYSDARLQQIINRAQRLIDNWLGQNIAFNRFTDSDIRCFYDYPQNGLAIQLPRRPIIEIKSIIITYSSKSQLIWDTASKLDCWRINEQVGFLEYFGLDISGYTLNVALRDPLASNIIPLAEVDYYAGYQTIPSDVTAATQTLVEQMLREDKGEDTQVSSVTMGLYKENLRRDKGIKGRGIIGQDEVAELLRPYRQPGKTMFTGGQL